MSVTIDDQPPKFSLDISDLGLLVLEDEGHEIPGDPEELRQRGALALQHALASLILTLLEEIRPGLLINEGKYLF